MHNVTWIMKDGKIRECSECVHYRAGRLMNLTCLGCRHEYLAHTDEEADEMDYPKPDLFKKRNANDTPSIVNGYWKVMKNSDGIEYFKCSECGAESYMFGGTPESKCFYCNARMEGEEGGKR